MPMGMSTECCSCEHFVVGMGVFIGFTPDKLVAAELELWMYMQSLQTAGFEEPWNESQTREGSGTVKKV